MYGQSFKKARFKIEKWWLQNLEFKELVKKVWSTRVEGDKAIDRWQNRVRMLSKKARGWSINIELEYRKRKTALSSEYDRLDVKAETSTLSKQERERENARDCWGVE
jgi:hypothetical protein